MQETEVNGWDKANNQTNMTPNPGGIVKLLQKTPEIILHEEENQGIGAANSSVNVSKSVNFGLEDQHHSTADMLMRTRTTQIDLQKNNQNNQNDYGTMIEDSR